MALGRGLGELLGEIEVSYENSSENNNHTINELDINLIEPNPYQPRKVFNEDKINELSESIIEHGLLQPIVVTRDGLQYLIVAGERRLRASKLANKTKIKAIVLEVDNSKLRELALIENIQRDDLNIIEISNSYAGLINDYNMTHEELSKIVSKSRSSVSNILRLLTLSDYSKDMLSLNKISLGHAKVIIGLEESEQKLIINSIIGQKLNVRETEILVKKLKEKSTKKEEIKSKTTTKNEFNYQQLKSLTEILMKNNLKVKIDKDYFKIKINSQEDIEKIAHHFNNI